MDPGQRLVHQSGLSLLVAPSLPGSGRRLTAILRQLMPYAAALGLLLMVRQSRLSERLNLFRLRPGGAAAAGPLRGKHTRADHRHQ
jgi:hypothetical protein